MKYFAINSIYLQIFANTLAIDSAYSKTERLDKVKQKFLNKRLKNIRKHRPDEPGARQDWMDGVQKEFRERTAFKPDEYMIPDNMKKGDELNVHSLWMKSTGNVWKEMSR